MHFLLVHGWGFHAGIWNGVVERLPGAGISLVDLGFIAGGPDGAECVPTKAEPDVSLQAADLAAAYLGAVEFSTLSRAGRVRAQTPDALSRADAMFATSLQAWCIHDF